MGVLILKCLLFVSRWKPHGQQEGCVLVMGSPLIMGTDAVRCHPPLPTQAQCAGSNELACWMAHFSAVILRLSDLATTTTTKYAPCQATARTMRASGWCLVSVVCMRCASALSAYTPAVAPRFDVFCEKIVGSWQVGVDQEPRSVEEVMRSCGGAVQGIREVLIDPEESVYLNRADDGFLCFDCGTFSYGPVDIRAPSARTINSFSLSPNRFRVQTTANLADSGSTLLSCTTHKLHCVSFGQKPEWKKGDFDVAAQSQMPIVHWHRLTRCSMPSTSQPWMLQRARWECQEIESDTAETVSPGLETEFAWLEVCDLAELRARLGSVDEAIHGAVGAMAVSAGVVCGGGDLVKSILRIYGTSGRLESVMLLEGSGGLRG